jgi:predicted membrane-bound spermidine synthase
MSAHRILGLRGGPKGLAVRQLKRYASWVQTVVRQVGPYLLWA